MLQLLISIETQRTLSERCATNNVVDKGRTVLTPRQVVVYVVMVFDRPTHFQPATVRKHRPNPADGSVGINGTTTYGTYLYTGRVLGKNLRMH